MSAHTQPRLTPEEYLEIERAAEFKSDYYDGHMYAMSGGSLRHAILIASVAFELGNALKSRPCTVVSSDLRLRVGSGRLYTYPDVVVFCGAPKLADQHEDILLNPTVVAEVLSPSTERYDRGVKWTQYRTIESLQEYALVSQTEPRVEVFRRQPGGHWLFTEFVGLDAICRFESLDCSITLSEVYRGIKFDDPPPAPIPFCEIIVSVKKFALVAAALFLGACSKDIQNKQALKDGVIEYLNARISQTGLDASLMDVDISSMSFERDQARATVVFRPKGQTEGAGMTMNYSFDRKGDKWVVHGRQDSGANPHGAGGLPAPGAAQPGTALPPGHPPASSNQ